MAKCEGSAMATDACAKCSPPGTPIIFGRPRNGCVLIYAQSATLLSKLNAALAAAASVLALGIGAAKADIITLDVAGTLTPPFQTATLSKKLHSLPSSIRRIIPCAEVAQPGLLEGKWSERASHRQDPMSRQRADCARLWWCSALRAWAVRSVSPKE
jgi:hypothetical protein